MALKIPRVKRAKDFLAPHLFFGFLANLAFFSIFWLFNVALRILGVALIVGEKGVALKVGEIAPQISPLCTRLVIDPCHILAEYF